MNTTVAQGWLDERPTFARAVGIAGELRPVSSLVGSPFVRGASHFCSVPLHIVVDPANRHIIITGRLGFACDKGNVLLCQLFLETDTRRVAADLTRRADKACTHLVRTLIFNLLGKRAYLQQPKETDQ